MDEIARWVRTVGQRAPVPAGVLIVAVGLAAHAGLLQGGALWIAGGLVIALVMTSVPFGQWFPVRPSSSGEHVKLARHGRATSSRRKVSHRSSTSPGFP